MDIAVLKFGGSSLADNKKLNLVAQRIIDFKNKGKKVVAVLSAQGNTTDFLVEQANDLVQEINIKNRMISKQKNDIHTELTKENFSTNIEKRELDVLLSVGEQISISKMAILLNKIGYKAISLLGWQIYLLTTKEHGEAKIIEICTNRILEELEQDKIVLVAGFQGIDKNLNITTLGRNGSDTTAVALTAALECHTCYIFSDVDGVYEKDPLKNKDAKKIEHISYEQMYRLAQNGAKVLHDRSIKIAQKYNIEIVVASSFEPFEEGKSGSRIFNY